MKTLAWIFGIFFTVVLITIGVLVWRVARPTPSPYKTEDQWLITEVVSDLAEIAAYVRDPKGRLPETRIEGYPTQAVVAHVTFAEGAPFQESLAFPHSVWEPEDYVALTRHVLDRLGVKSTPAANHLPSTLLADLLDLRASVIDEAEQKVSARLAAQPAAAELHEQAALVLMAFALRENAATYSDNRRALCRMTAHLAMAAALRGEGPPSLAGQWAAAGLATLGGRGAEANRLLALLEPQAGADPAQAAWSRVFRMRLTDDRRLLPDPESASLAERIAWLRASVENGRANRVLRDLEKTGPKPGREVDWALTFLSNPSVEIGQVFAPAAPNVLLAEAHDVAVRHHRNENASFIDALNDPPARFRSPEGPRVIAWGTWANMYQRHLLYLLVAQEEALRYQGQPDEARRFRAAADRSYSRLRSFPFIRACWELDRDGGVTARSRREALKLVTEHPELLTVNRWWGLEYQMQVRGVDFPTRTPWFSPVSVRGTAYDFCARGQAQHVNLVAQRVAEFAALAPDDRCARYWTAAGRAKASRSLATLAEDLGPRAEYDVNALDELANQMGETAPEVDLRPLRELQCKIDADFCWQLGELCVEEKDDACAVAAYDRAVDFATDPIAVSNISRWIMRYHAEHDRLERALEIADKAADTYSAEGLLTKARYLEMAHDPRAAEALIFEQAGRYNEDGQPDPEELFGFYYRLSEGQHDVAYKQKYDALARRYFPHGLKRCALTSLSGPPARGVRFATATPEMRRAEVRLSDVVVGLDGWCVEDLDQYGAARAIDTDNPDFVLLVWRDGQYRELPIRRVTRKFGVHLNDWVAGQ